MMKRAYRYACAFTVGMANAMAVLINDSHPITLHSVPMVIASGIVHVILFNAKSPKDRE